MAAPPVPNNVGDLLPDDREVFRAFSDKSYRERKATRNRVRSGAYQLREDDIADGLSVGLTPEAAVRHLQTNFGYCSISVGTIHALPYHLEVRSDPRDPDHAFICNLPLMTISDEQRELAVLVAGELARRSQVITCDPFMPEAPDPAD
jgi:hypothetical protein